MPLQIWFTHNCVLNGLSYGIGHRFKFFVIIESIVWGRTSILTDFGTILFIRVVVTVVASITAMQKVKTVPITAYVFLRQVTGFYCDKRSIRRRRDYITGFIAPAIGPNKSKKLTQLIAPTHNIRGKIWIKNKYVWLHRRQLSVCEAMYVIFHSNFAVYIVCQRCKPCEFLWFVWTDCRGNKSYYVIISSANTHMLCIHVTLSSFKFQVLFVFISF